MFLSSELERKMSSIPIKDLKSAIENAESYREGPLLTVDDDVCVAKQHVRNAQLADLPAGGILGGHQHCK